MIFSVLVSDSKIAFLASSSDTSMFSGPGRRPESERDSVYQHVGGTKQKDGTLVERADGRGKEGRDTGQTAGRLDDVT